MPRLAHGSWDGWWVFVVDDSPYGRGRVGGFIRWVGDMGDG